MAKVDVSWTPEMDVQLKGLIEDGLTAAEIGNRMGHTRNAIIGRKNRLKLRMKSNHPSTPDRYRNSTPVKRQPKVKPHLIVCEPVEGVGIPFIDAIGKHACTFFLEGQSGAFGHVCGEARFPAASYCADHLLIAYQRAPVAQRRAA